MAKITKSMLKGKTSSEVQQMLQARERAGKLTKREIEKAVKYLQKLADGKYLTDDDIVNVLNELN